MGGLKAVLANGGELEEGVRLKQLDGAPDLNQPGPDFNRKEKPRERRDDTLPKGPRPDREERSSDKPRREKPKGEKPRGDKPRGDKPAGSKRVWDDKKPRKDDRKPAHAKDPAKEHRGRVKPDPVARQEDEKPKTLRKKGGADPSKSFRKKDGGKLRQNSSGKPSSEGKRAPAKLQKPGKKSFGGDSKPRRKG